MLSAPLSVTNKSGFLPDGRFSILFFRMFNDGKFTIFLNKLLQSIVSALLGKRVLQSQGEIQKKVLSSRVLGLRRHKYVYNVREQ